ncbi:dTDP-4-amino-4,6-dideoxygalactose transaminase [Paenibacillus montaniterrae]|uniref:dTDP-4-amino-4,6-dideoxygalactose transaminase n=1 Tax=Paenibacillus montaniterrae TaxID=429341 RepID=A0A919YXP4_9BACL|nr:dTDP-4-amino-4,6-dideoxygalactose transaminase [Paenibacillus montaniterrae]GIP19106.1 dTDP-4-amino-4,6-dideoxygalactose transaminase [Paenibacillus montaniterrae]
MIKFNIAPVAGQEIEFIQDAINSRHLCGDGKYTELCSKWLEKTTGTPKVLLTTSCTHALEMAALLFDIKHGDEVIMPSYTFVSTANAFVLRGAKIIFVDIRPDTMNIDETKIEAAITNRTKVIVPVHYAGVACEMDTIMNIAERYNLYVVEDAAQGIMSTYKGRMLGSIGHLGTFSFHETKNLVCGEGGALLVNDRRLIERAEIIREKGTNRSQFISGRVDKYTWRDIGSSYLMSELTAAYLYSQLINAQYITKKRLKLWSIYYQYLYNFIDIYDIELPCIPNTVEHNGHLFFIKLKNKKTRDNLIEYLKDRGIQATFHYIPLHTTETGKKYGEFHASDNMTCEQSDKLLRLPMFFSLEEETVIQICNVVVDYLKKAREKI